MADDIKLFQRRQRGQAAQRILDNALVKEAFETIEERIYKLWKESEPDNDRGRHDLYLMHNLFIDLREFFKDVVKHGNQAQKELLRREQGEVHGRR